MQVIFTIILFVLFFFFISAPDVAFEASQKAILLWANTVVPSMLPFLILNGLLSRIGGIAFIGKIFRHPAEKLLKLPGEAAFVLASGYSTGVPVSASVIADLRKANKISREEGNRLLAFGANVSPAFLLSAVSISMLGNETVGSALAMIHYGTNLGLMLLFCILFRTKGNHNAHPYNQGEKKTPPTMEALTDSIFQSLHTIFLIGGMILCFFVLIVFFRTIGIIDIFTTRFHLSTKETQFLTGLFCGFMEITAGSSVIAESNLPFTQQCALISAILAFGGLSATMQIASVIRETDLSLGFYLKYKLLQSGIAWAITLKIPFFTEETFVPTVHTPQSPVIFHMGAMPAWIEYSGTVISLAAILFIFLRFLYARRH